MPRCLHVILELKQSQLNKNKVVATQGRKKKSVGAIDMVTHQDVSDCLMVSGMKYTIDLHKSDRFRQGQDNAVWISYYCTIVPFFELKIILLHRLRPACNWTARKLHKIRISRWETQPSLARKQHLEETTQQDRPSLKKGAWMPSEYFLHELR